MEDSENVSVCASVINPNINTLEFVQLSVFSVDSTAQGNKTNYIIK